MNLTLNKTEFLNSIKLVKNAVNTNDLIPITKCILLNADGAELFLTANDLEMSVNSRITDCDIEQSGAVAIDAKLLNDIIAKVPSEIITLRGSDKQLEIYSGKSITRLAAFPAAEFPTVSLSEYRNEFASITEQDFLNLLKGTIFSVSIYDSKSALNGVLIEVKPDEFSVTTSDGFRISQRRVKGNFNTSNRILFLGSCATKLIKMLNAKSSGVISVYTTDNHFVIETNKCTITTRLMNDEYPNMSAHLQRTCSSFVETDADLFLESLERMKIVSTKSDNVIKLAQDGASLILTMGGDTIYARDELDAFLSGPPVDLYINIDYLISIMKVITEGIVSIGLTDSNSPVFIRGQNDDFDYMVLPIRYR